MRLNKKGIIFALDGAIAVTIVLIMLINTTHYFTTASKESLSQTQVIKRGYDVLSMFDELEQLDDGFGLLSTTATSISEEFIAVQGGGLLLNISNFLPDGYDMQITLDDARKTACIDIPVGECTLSSISGNLDTFITTETLVAGGALTVQVNVQFASSPGPNPTVIVDMVGKDYAVVQANDGCTLIATDCTFTTLTPVEGFVGGSPSEIKIEWVADDLQVNWIKILDDPAYALSTERTIPTNRFIGSGERWFAAFDSIPSLSGNHFEGFHRARFKIWIV